MVDIEDIKYEVTAKGQERAAMVKILIYSHSSEKISQVEDEVRIITELQDVGMEQYEAEALRPTGVLPEQFNQDELYIKWRNVVHGGEAEWEGHPDTDTQTCMGCVLSRLMKAGYIDVINEHRETFYATIL